MIVVDRLTKLIGGRIVVDRVSFECRPGTITGLLGPHGSGKTTVLRLVTGLSRPSSGSVRIGGHAYRDLPRPGRYVGVLPGPGIGHGGRSGRELLALGALALGVRRRRVDELMSVVGLSEDDARRGVRHYSPQMRQRLGIAHALLGDPRVLVLDEPADGLDPAGLRWLGDLLRGYADRGGTVLLSSHLPEQVEQVADALLLVGAGRVVVECDPAAIGTGSPLNPTFVHSQDDGRLRLALRRGGAQVSDTPGGLLVHADSELIGRTAAGLGIALVELCPGRTGTLEDALVTLASDEPPGPPPSPAAVLPFGRGRGVAS